MLEQIGDIWELSKKSSEDDDTKVIVVSTNGIIKKNGLATMGRGIALEAAQRYPNLPIMLASNIRINGNCVYSYMFENHFIFTFPTKYHWANPSDIDLIQISLVQLVELVDNLAIEKIYLPKVGCGAGQLNWKDVKSLLSNLDDRFIVVSKEE